MEKNIMLEVLRQTPMGFAYHKVLLNDEGEVIDFIFLDINPAFQEMLGLTKENILGKRATEIMPKSTSFEWVDFYYKATLTGEKQSFTQYIEPLQRWYKITAFAPEKGYFITLFQEFASEKERIDTLADQKKQIGELSTDLEMIFNGTHDAMFLVKVDKGEFCYIRNNSAHQLLTGFHLNDLKNKTPVELVGKEIGEVVEANYQKCIEANTIITYEEILELPGGIRNWLTTLKPVFEDNKVKYIVGSSKDITMQKRAEGELKKRLKYEKIISGVSRLALKERSLDIFVPEFLRLMGEGIGISRAYLFQTDHKGTMSNTFEWTAPDITPQIENLQKIPDTEFTWWVKRLTNREIINYRDIEDIPDENTKTILKFQNIKSILVLPVFIEDVYYGFIGFDDCLEYREWTEPDINLLTVAAEIMSSFILLQEKEEKLWLENQRFRALVDSTEDIIFTLDREQRITAVFGKWMEQDGVTSEYFRGKTLRDFLGEEKALVYEETNKKVLAGETALTEFSIKRNGQPRLYQTFLSPIKDREGTVSGIVGIGRDITELKNAQQELEEEKELLRVTLLSIGDGVITTDRQGKITSINRVAKEITEFDDEVKGQYFSHVFKLISEETGEKVEDPVAKVLYTGTIIEMANHTVLITKYGRKVPVADSAAPIKNHKGQILGAVLVFRDVSRQKEQQKRILYMSYHDSLTGLYNRRFLEEKIKKINTSKHLPLSIIICDVNGLKLTNDVFGHETGDKLLIKAAEILKKVCSEKGIIARWGGDEFLIVMPQTSDKTAEKIKQNIKSRCFQESIGSIQLSIAIGLAVKTNKGQNLQQTMKEAEEWMYRQKLIEGKSYRKHIINTMMATLFEKSQESEEHVERLKNYCLEIGKNLKLSLREIEEVVLLAALHDIGKISINKNILNKPGPLNPDEWEEMKKHPEFGFRIVRNIPELSSVAEYILFHHERWDGKGYPRGVKGKEIPLLSRIIAVADAYDAMTSSRKHQKTKSKEEAIAEIKRYAGTQFDPKIVNAFLDYIDPPTEIIK